MGNIAPGSTAAWSQPSIPNAKPQRFRTAFVMDDILAPAVLLSSPKLIDTHVCEPQVRALLETAAHVCEVVAICPGCCSREREICTDQPQEDLSSKPSSGRFFVSKIAPGSAADWSGEVRVGDEIVTLQVSESLAGFRESCRFQRGNAFLLQRERVCLWHLQNYLVTLQVSESHFRQLGSGNAFPPQRCRICTKCRPRVST